MDRQSGRGAEQGVRAEHSSMMRHRPRNRRYLRLWCFASGMSSGVASGKRLGHRLRPRHGRRCHRHWIWKWHGAMTCVCVEKASMRETGDACWSRNDKKQETRCR